MSKYNRQFNDLNNYSKKVINRFVAISGLKIFQNNLNEYNLKILAKIVFQQNLSILGCCRLKKELLLYVPIENCTTSQNNLIELCTPPGQ